MAIEKIFRQARDEPGKLAISYRGRSIGYGEFARCIAHARRLLGGQGLRSGCLAALDVDCALDAWIFDFALRSLGITTIAGPSLEKLYELGVPNIGCAITTIRDRPLGAAPRDADFKLVRIPQHLYLNEPPDAVADLPRAAAPAGGHVLVTSGTTGARKKVLIDAASLALIAERYAEVFEISERSLVNVFGFTMWTGAGYKIPFSAWSMGGSVAFDRGGDGHSSLLAGGITHAIFTPATLSELLKAPPEETRRNGTLGVYVGGGPLSRSLAAAARTRLAPRLFTYAVSTEAGVWALTPIERLEDLHSHRIHPSVDVQVVDPADRPLPAGQVGAVRVRSVDGVTGYLDDEATSRAVFRQGYFYPGDLGAFEADGRLVLHGRAANVINVLGYKVAVERVEQALQDRLDANGVGILTVQREGIVEELHVVIAPRRPLGEAELASSIGEELPGCPVARVHFVNDLPRNEGGKIDRAALRQQVFALPAGQPD